MQRCLELAKYGLGNVSPNPLVGCVIAKNGKIIGEGYHKKFGSAHAEINAIKDACLNRQAKRKRNSLKGSTLYVNLEPCSHQGKTKPCVDKIIKNKIAKVVIGIKDPNPDVAGNGIKKLRENGIKVETNILKEECLELNKFFFKHIQTGIPYVTLKVAQSLDGKITDKKYNSKWISGEDSRKYVHKLRSKYDAVLIGRNTLEKDNPKLTVRNFKGRNPLRIILDTKLTSKLNKNVFTDSQRKKTIVITSKKADKRKVKELNLIGVEVLFCSVKDKRLNLAETLKILGELGINSVLVEGGGEIFSSFVKENLADELLMFISSKVMGKGIDALDSEARKVLTKASKVSYEEFQKDVLVKIKF